jgi:DNA-directed RNA polymerase subunit RPC12/RpoP
MIKLIDLIKENSETIECEKCGWKWNTKDSKEHDKYVCHKCGHDNSSNYINQ